VPVREHTSSASEPNARGRAFGESLRPEVAHTVAFYLQLFAASAQLDEADVVDFGRAVRGTVGRRHPRLLAEIDGIAAGAGVDADVLVAINARTELLSSGDFSGGRVPADAAPRPPAECSNVALLPDATRGGTLLLGQTWDFHPDLFPSRALWTFPLGEERWATTFTEAGVLAKVGLNSDRVGIAMAFLASRSDRPHGGMPVHLLARLLLEECRNASDALRLLSKQTMSASVALTVGYAEATGIGFATTAELSPHGMQLLYPDELGVLTHTNHFLGAGGGDDLALGPSGWHGTVVRQDVLRRALRRAAAHGELDGAALEQLFKMRFNAPESICVRAVRGEGEWYREVETLATIVLDLTHRTVVIDDGVHDGGRLVRALDVTGVA
jgi:isopenicillin-N N-acyltransferase-like protein